MNEVMLIDGHNLGYRGLGQAPLTHDGKRIEVVYLGLRQLLFYMKRFAPSEVVVVWDSGLDSERLESFPDYKKRKPVTPTEEAELKELHRQISLFKDVILRLGIATLCCKGREADDVIYSLIHRGVRSHAHVRAEFPILRSNIGNTINRKINSVKVLRSIIKSCERKKFLIVSTDKDYFQLLQAFPVEIYSPMKDEVVDAARAREILGFDDLEAYPFYKAIIGGHDNIPGIQGIGPVCARWMMEERAKRIASERPAFGFFWEYVTASDISAAGVPSRFIKPMIRLSEQIVDVWKWTRLSHFKLLPMEELEEGFEEQQFSSYMNWCREAYYVLKDCGFHYYLDRFLDFSIPFEQYLQRKEVT